MSQTDELAASEAAATNGHDKGALDPAIGRLLRSRNAVISLLVLVGFVIWAIFETKVRTTLIAVVAAVGGSAGLWIAANLVFDQVRERWRAFSALATGLVGAFVGIVIHGNNLTVGSGDGFLNWVIGPIVGAAIFAITGYVLATTEEASTRMAIGLGLGTGLGILIGALIRDELHPGLNVVPIIVCLALGVAIGGALSALRGKPPIGGALLGASLGWLAGAWGGADLGEGSILTSIIATVVATAALGAVLGRTNNPDKRARDVIDHKSRAVIFVGPALLFIFVMLVVPALRTGYLSLLDRTSDRFVWFDNYTDVFTDRVSLDVSDAGDFFTSRLTLLGVVILLAAAYLATRAKRETGKALELGNAAFGPLIAGGLLVTFGAFTALRGTIINNLWWVVMVTFASTAVGLAVAVLADNRRGEKLAKSLIFMPMAISLVGASIIWRFMYAARDTSKEQTGVLNALWVGLGNISTKSGIGWIVGLIVIGLLLLTALRFVGAALVAKNYSNAAIPGVVTLLLGWLFLRWTRLVGDGVGGFSIDPETGAVSPDTILFVQESPFNNVWLMVILIWIQTGFAMVILSAAIKAVPGEFIEAARMDGATESQIFWRITLPQIATTIGVVVTTLIVLVMKVFDIVKVVTNGQFDTQVLANDMFNQAFQNSNTGKGAALAMLIFISVLPVMYYNIRRMQEET